MAATSRWTREQLLVAFTLYSQLPFGKMHARNAEIKQYAALIGRTPSALAMKLVNLASLDPMIIESGRSGLTQVSKMDRELWQEMDRDPDAFELQCQQAIAALPQHSPLSCTPSAQETPADYYGQERQHTVKTRIGQQLFRKRVLSAYHERCCITGLAEPSLLVASHILPWRDAPEHRLDPSNGLCLSALHDKAFDIGLITVNDHLELILSPRLKKRKDRATTSLFEAYEGKPLQLPPDARYAPNPAHLRYHREQVFVKR
ncbi:MULTISPECIES: HNH endonuclease [Dickeya]|uniref:Possible restriction endonuclease n=1 Tax=Dickeya aquatica TaxID=1401087 RepID=A0A375A6S7_9GAMM|nr:MULTISPECIES: HNH endonuclease [Dickeya]SLM61626.1 Possible restriction endonuclease [Dickeya aquatica]